MRQALRLNGAETARVTIGGKRYTVGQIVTVYYQKGQPDRPRMKGLSVQVFFGLFLCVLAVVALGWGYLKRSNEKDVSSLKEFYDKKDKDKEKK